MAKRLTPFIGLAVVAALALAAAFGAFSLSPAYAGDEAPNARGLAQTGDFQSQAATNLPVPSFLVENSAATTPRTDIEKGANSPANMRLRKGGTATIDLANAIVNVATNTGADRIDRYYLILPTDGAVTVGDGGGNQVYSRTINDVTTGTSTEVTITGAAGGVVRAQVIAEDTDSTGVDNPATSDSEVHSNYWFSIVVVEPELRLTSENTSANTRQDVTFLLSSDLSAGTGEITIELEDFGFPGSVDVGSVGILSDAWYATSDYGGTPDPGDDNHIGITVANTVAGYNSLGNRLPVDDAYQSGVVSPTDVTVSGEELKISVPDMNPETDRAEGMKAGDLISVVLRQGSGITNPSEGKGARGDATTGYMAKISNNVDTIEQETGGAFVPRRVTLNEDSGGRGTAVTATGHGFKNGTTLIFFLDGPASATDDARNGEKDTGEVELCSQTVASNDTASCTFNVSNPPFTSGLNYVGAEDGLGNNANKAADNKHGDQEFDLEPSITTSPGGGNPGETILVQGTDFPVGATLSAVTLAGDARDLQDDQRLSASVSGTGDLSFRFIIPNWAEPGIKRLTVEVTATGGATSDDNTNVTIGGPTLVSTPTTVLPNQRISLVGTGFSPGSRITGGALATADPPEQDPSITIGGFVIPDELINDNDPVSVDNGGKWSASVDLPLRSVTTRDGAREIRVTDSYGRSGTVSVTIPARSVTIDPPSGRIGTEATIRGTNFPSKNDNGESFNIQIIYDPGGDRETQVTTVSDAGGRFETKIRIPSGATIPSTNPVRVIFEDEQGTEVTTTVSHEVPEGTIVLSANSGLPGTTITLRGEGFKAFVPVRSVKVGSIEVTPSPAPSTDALGQMEFEILIPGLDTGIQTIEVQVSDTTASIGFTVQSGNIPGAVTPVAEGVADLGDNFVRAFNFDNDTKTWTFYDPDPDVADASTMENFIAGNSYWILVGSTADAILNRETRTLTCVNDNCWNLIVW